jgi:hypothetical protein
MDKNEISHPAFGVRREPGELHISLPVKSDRFRTLLNLVWLVIWAAGEIAIVLFILGPLGRPGVDPSPALPLSLVFLAAFTAGGGIVLWRWLWRVGGRETFLVVRGEISARREIWGIGHSRTFDLERIGSVNAGRLKYRVIYPSWGRMFIGQDESELVIEWAGRSYVYGKGLTTAEAGDLARLLNEGLGFRFSKSLLPSARPAYWA